MDWISPTQVVSELNIYPSGDSIDQIVQCVRAELAALHPDKTNGKFATASGEERWHLLVSAKGYLESLQSTETAMIPINQLPALIRSMIEATKEPIAVRSSRLIAESTATIRQRTFFPKLTSGIFAGISGFLVAASGSLQNHPLFGHLLSLKGTQIFLLYLMAAAATLFLWFWMKEGRTERYLEWLLSGEGTSAVLSRVLRSATKKETGLVFNFRQVVNAISGRPRFDPSKPASETLDQISMRRIDRTLAEKTARIIIDKLKEEQVITELPRGGFNQHYEISKTAAQEINQADDEA